LAEDLGFQRVVASDHVLIGSLKGYPYKEFPVPADYPFLDPLIYLASIGGATTRIRLTSGIVIAPLRPAALLAKMAATLDVMCGGRFELGVGTGWQRSEYEALGVDFDARGQIFDDTMRACVALWRDSPASFASAHVAFDDVYCRPKPLQANGVPIWVGGPASRRTARRVAEFGAGWIVASNEPIPEELRRGGELIAEAMRVTDRDPSSFDIMVPAPLIADDDGQPSLERSLESARDYVELGITNLTLTIAPMMPDGSDPMRFLEALPARCAELGFPLRPSADD
jgi:probable F420-dependent oxidoreductase